MQKNDLAELIFYFFSAALLVIFIFNLSVGLVVHFFDNNQSILWHTLTPFIIVFILIFLIISAFFKYKKYQNNSENIAKYLKAIKINPTHHVPEEAIVLKINNEIAKKYECIPAHIYILYDEFSINALTVGYTENNITIILTWGALQSTNYKELELIIAYEYYKINKKYFIKNTYIDIVFSGLIFISKFGNSIIKHIIQKNGIKSHTFSSSFILIFGGLIFLLGSVGILINRFVKFLISSQQQYQTDIDFHNSMNNNDFLYVMMRIHAHNIKSYLYHIDIEFITHYCFINPLNDKIWFNINPSLDNRILNIKQNSSDKFNIIQDQNYLFLWKQKFYKIFFPLYNSTEYKYLYSTKSEKIQSLPILRLLPIHFIKKDAVRALSPEIRQTMERPQLLQRAMQTATGCREIIIAIFMIRQYQESIPDNAEISQAIIAALLRLDNRVHIQIFYESLSKINLMPITMSHIFEKKIINIIQLDGKIGLLDCLLLEKVKSTQNLIHYAKPIARRYCVNAIVELVDAILHVQQIDIDHRFFIRNKILKQLLTYKELIYFSKEKNGSVNLPHSLNLVSGLLTREKLYFLSVIEYELWSERVITQDEQDVLSLLYWRFGFESKEAIERVLKQNSLLIL